MANGYFEGERPIGARTSGLKECISPPPFEWLTREIPEYNQDMSDLGQNNFDPALAPQQHLDTLIRLLALMKAATAGTLTVGATEEYPVRTLSTAVELLELRPYWEKTGAIKPPRLTRLYYGEPKEEPSNLLPLHIATKPNGPDIKSEQQQAIAEADSRASAWAHARFVTQAK